MIKITQSYLEETIKIINSKVKALDLSLVVDRGATSTSNTYFIYNINKQIFMGSAYETSCFLDGIRFCYGLDKYVSEDSLKSSRVDMRKANSEIFKFLKDSKRLTYMVNVQRENNYYSNMIKYFLYSIEPFDYTKCKYKAEVVGCILDPLGRIPPKETSHTFEIAKVIDFSDCESLDAFEHKLVKQIDEDILNEMLGFRNFVYGLSDYFYSLAYMTTNRQSKLLALKSNERYFDVGRNTVSIKIDLAYRESK